MSFTIANWTCVSNSMSQGQEFVNGVLLNAPNIFTYGSPNDTIAEIAAANYFLPVYTNVSTGDIILGSGSDGTFGYVVTASSVSGVTTSNYFPSGSGSVSSVGSGTGLTGGPITTTGTLSFAPIAANSFWANATGSSAVPTVQTVTALGLALLADSTQAQAQATLLGTFSAGSVIFSNGTVLSQNNASLNWDNTNYTFHVTQPSTYLSNAPVCVITSDPSGAHGHGDMLNIDGNPAGGGTISRTDGGLFASSLQLTGGDHTTTTGGTIYLNGNNSTESGSPGSVQATLGISSAAYQFYDYTQSILLWQVNNAGVMQIPALTTYSILATDASHNVTPVASSTSGYVLTSNGAGSAPTFQASGGGGGQPLNQNLTDISGLTPTLDSIIYGNGTHYAQVTPVTQQAVYVASNGNDTSGNGSIIFPYLTIGKALSTITTSSSTNPYVVFIEPGTYSETGLEIPVWVFLQGSAQQPTKIIDTSGAIKINSATYNSGSQRLGFANLNLINSTGITIDFQAIGGSGSNQVYINNCQVVGPVIMRGRGSDDVTGFDNRFFGTYTSSAMQEVHYSGYFANAVTFNTSGVTSVSVDPAFTSMTFFSNATFTSSGSGNTMNATLISSEVSGTLTVDQATTTVFADSVSLNAGTLSQTNSGIISYLDVAKYVGYTPSVSGNWSPIPTQVAGALDTLAARSSGTTWTVETSSTALVKGNGYFANSGSSINFTLPSTATVGDTFSVANMNTGGFVIAQNAGQSIRYGNTITTTGAGGSIASTNNGDTLTIVCNVTNTGFQVVNSDGQLNVT